MTFSLVARDPHRGDLGIAVQSKFLAVGAVVPWARAGVGAIATQSWANTSYGPRGLDLLLQGLSAKAVLEHLLETDAERARRQVGIVGVEGPPVTSTGDECFPWAGGLTGADYACQGNILVGEDTVLAMAQAFEQSAGPTRCTAAGCSCGRAGCWRRPPRSAIRGGAGRAPTRWLRRWKRSPDRSARGRSPATHRGIAAPLHLARAVFWALRPAGSPGHRPGSRHRIANVAHAERRLPGKQQWHLRREHTPGPLRLDRTRESGRALA